MLFEAKLIRLVFFPRGLLLKYSSVKVIHILGFDTEFWLLVENERERKYSFCFKWFCSMYFD